MCQISRPPPSTLVRAVHTPHHATPALPSSLPLHPPSKSNTALPSRLSIVTESRRGVPSSIWSSATTVPTCNSTEASGTIKEDRFSGEGWLAKWIYKMPPSIWSSATTAPTYIQIKVGEASGL